MFNDNDFAPQKLRHCIQRKSAQDNCLIMTAFLCANFFKTGFAAGTFSFPKLSKRGNHFCRAGKRGLFLLPARAKNL